MGVTTRFRSGVCTDPGLLRLRNEDRYWTDDDRGIFGVPLVLECLILQAAVVDQCFGREPISQFTLAANVGHFLGCIGVCLDDVRGVAC